MRKKKYNILFLFLCLIAFGCSDNPVDNKENLIYQLDGIIENIGGDCSGVQVRTRSIGNLDLTNTGKVRFNFTAMSDADLSSLSIFYLQNDQLIYLVNLPDREQINNTSSIEIDSPNFNGELFTRVTLKSSVCTGQIFYLTFRDLKIYTKN
jgi:hypothetical protein